MLCAVVGVVWVCCKRLRLLLLLPACVYVVAYVCCVVVCVCN